MNRLGSQDIVHLGRGEFESGWSVPIGRMTFLRLASQIQCDFLSGLLSLDLELNQEGFNSAIVSWQRRWNLPDQWVTEYVRERLINGYWRKPNNHTPVRTRPTLRQKKISFTHDINLDSLVQESGHEFERIVGAFRDYLRKEFDGIVPARHKQEEHFEWLVRYQIQGWSHERIRREYNVSRENVRKRIPEVASLIRLTLRAPKGPGRPRKN